MKKYLIYYFICLLPLFVGSCDNFEPYPLNLNTKERALNPGDSTDNNAAKQMFYACYLGLPSLHNRIDNSYLDAATDDALPTTSNSYLDYWRTGLISAGNLPDNGAWRNGYMCIRYVNQFLENINIFSPSAQLPADYIKQMKAEARLLRAYYYFEMMKRWGGVPLIGDKIFEIDDDVNIPRASIQEVADYINKEISPDVNGSCFYDLHPAQSIASDEDPNNPSNMIGHVNQGVALGILSRLHLYLASDLYNESKDVSKWQTAADWAKRLIDLNVYELYDKTSRPAFQFAMDVGEFPNKEMIMVKIAATTTYNIEILNAPAGIFIAGTSVYASRGYTSPSQNLVDAFLTLDGKSIYKNYNPDEGYDPDAGYNDQIPYDNRDPRLRRFIFTNGSPWLNQAVEIFDGGMHRGGMQGVIYTRTGYYLKKFLGDNEFGTSYTAYFHHYQIIRYAEILLNYAEAMNEFDPSNDEEITKGLIALRKRAGIRPGDDFRYGIPQTYTQELMRNIIRNERRIELCFEEHRFWDVRRWKIAENVLNKPVRGVRITKNPDRSLSFSYEDVANSSFRSHMYWYPIPRTEMWGNSAMVQNPGWSY